MTDSDQHSRSIEIWEKISKHLRDEVDGVVYGPWLSPLSFVDVRDGVLRLAHPSGFRRDWVMNTYDEYILALWREQDDSITELKIIIRDRPNPAEGEQQSKPEGVTTKPRPIAISARDTQPAAPAATNKSVMDPADKAAERADVAPAGRESM